MKVVSAWREYDQCRLVAVTEDGEIFTAFYDRDVAGEWSPLIGPIQRYSRKSPTSSTSTSCANGS
jgi:hypothetical protein